MTTKKSEKLKFLLNTVPPGFLVDGRFLRTHRFQSKSIGDYVTQGWLERIGWGVFRRPMPNDIVKKLSNSFSDALSDDLVTVVPATVAVVSMQRIMGYDFHVGGFSALSLFGHEHDLPLGGNGKLHLYGDTPSWITRVLLDAQPVSHTRALFAGNPTLGILDADRHVLTKNPELSVWHYSIKASSPERAILEAIDELPQHTSFDAVAKVFESLSMLRPKLIIQLLQACQSVKVKRLFFVFADHHRHAWRDFLNMGDVSLGSGPRALVKGGKLHPLYQIAVAQPYLPSTDTHSNQTSEPLTCPLIKKKDL